jgi:predicted amino acid racemase
MLAAGVVRLADSRIANIKRMRDAGVRGPMTLLRSPMISEVAEVVAFADVSLNSELDVISRLSSAAQAAGRTHGVVLMVELGDLREGIMPGDLESAARETLRLPGISLRGIGANLACRNGVAPDDRNMTELSRLTRSVEASVGRRIALVSGGNSASLDWALGDTDTGRINDLRLGEAILLGRNPLNRRAIQGLHTDAVTLTAEVIESKLKPSLPWGNRGENAFGEKPVSFDAGSIAQTILAIGRQDTDPSGLTAPAGVELLGASSDHLIVDSGTQRLSAGSELTFQLDYSALLRAMTSPFVEKTMLRPEGRVPVGHDPLLMDTAVGAPAP